MIVALGLESYQWRNGYDGYIWCCCFRLVGLKPAGGEQHYL